MIWVFFFLIHIRIFLNYNLIISSIPNLWVSSSSKVLWLVLISNLQSKRCLSYYFLLFILDEYICRINFVAYSCQRIFQFHYHYFNSFQTFSHFSFYSPLSYFSVVASFCGFSESSFYCILSQSLFY